MTKKEKEQIKAIALKVEHIVDYDNKNLRNRQLYALEECLDTLKALLGKKPNEMI